MHVRRPEREIEFDVTGVKAGVKEEVNGLG